MANRRILVDVDRCTGCWSCTMVCHVAHHLNEDEYRMFIRTNGGGGIDEPEGEFPNVHMSFQPVFTNSCTMCGDRLAEGKEPYCMRNCPSRVIIQGDLDDPESEISERYQTLLSRGYHVETPSPWEGLKPQAIYMHKA